MLEEGTRKRLLRNTASALHRVAVVALRRPKGSLQTAACVHYHRAMASFDEAVAALYQAPLDKFVEERKRLAAELKSGGDKPGAARLAKLGRPTIAAWAVNQLYWQARDTFDELFAAGQRLRAGDRGAAGARREAMAKLRSCAIAILGDSGHPAPEATLRRLANSLSALAAAGGFDPDPPGALAGDRETLGFDITGLVVPETGFDSDEGAVEPEAAPPMKTEMTPAKVEPPASKAARARELAEAKQRREAEEARAREELQRAEQERRRQAEAAAKIAVERRRLEAALRVAKSQFEMRTREVNELRRQLGAAERMLEESRATATEVEARLAALETRT